MFHVIDIQETPNPDALKFILDSSIQAFGVKQFDSAEEAKAEPLAHTLFSLEGVQSVFYMGDFVTITKSPATSWITLKNQITQTLQSSFDQKTNSPSTETLAKTVEENELLERINIVLDANIRPALADDGGGLTVIGLDDYILTIHYQGACGTCPSATQGTLGAVQNLLQRLVDPRIHVVSN